MTEVCDFIDFLDLSELVELIESINICEEVCASILFTRDSFSAESSAATINLTSVKRSWLLVCKP